MGKDERILKKVGKLLSLYGVSDDEKEKFLLDLQDKKYDDQEEVDEVVDDEKPLEEEKEEVIEEEINEEQPAEELEQPKDDDPKVEEEQSAEVGEEEVVEESPLEEQKEEVVEEQPVVEEEQLEQPEEIETNDVENRVIELEKTNTELAARLAKLEEIIVKLGVPVDEEGEVGLSPNPSPSLVGENDAFDRIINKRVNG